MKTSAQLLKTAAKLLQAIVNNLDAGTIPVHIHEDLDLVKELVSVSRKVKSFE